MKKTNCVILLVCMMLAMCSCKDKPSIKLAEYIESIRSEMHEDIGAFGGITGIEYDTNNNNVLIEHEINDNVYLIDTFGGDAQEWLLLYMCNNKGLDLLKYLLDADASLKVRFHGAYTADSYSMDITHEDIKYMLCMGEMNQKEHAEIIVESLIKREEAYCPRQVNDATILEEIETQDNTIIYTYTVYENVEGYEDMIDTLENKKSSYKQEILASFKTEPILAGFMENIFRAGYDLKHVYTGSESGKSVAIEFGNDELHP